MSDIVQVHKMEILIIDHDGLGAEEWKVTLENTNYGNHVGPPEVKKTETKEVDWTDEHPLNYRDKCAAAYAELFDIDP